MIKKLSSSVKATMEFEGFVITEEDEKLVLQKLNDEITHEEFIRMAKEQAKKESKQYHPNSRPLRGL